MVIVVDRPTIADDPRNEPTPPQYPRRDSADDDAATVEPDIPYSSICSIFELHTRVPHHTPSARSPDWHIPSSELADSRRICRLPDKTAWDAQAFATHIPCRIHVESRGIDMIVIDPPASAAQPSESLRVALVHLEVRGEDRQHHCDHVCDHAVDGAHQISHVLRILVERGD